MSYTHLHVHTEYSLLDGAARIEPLIDRVKELGMDSVAITDHGVMFGVIDFYRAAKKAGIKPIIGCEVYVAERTRFDKDVNYDKRQGHLVLLAENNDGYKNLVKIVSKGYTEGFYYKPRIDNDVLRKYSKGIIASSACLAGRVQRALINRDYETAKKEALEYQDIFGKGNFFLEIQDQGLEEEKRINPLLLKLSGETGIGLIATNDVHYINREDADIHDVLLCIQTGAHVSDTDRMRFPNDQFYLKSEEEMRRIFHYVPEAIENTHRIAERCNVDFEFGKLHLPQYAPPEGMDNRRYLRSLCERGFEERYGAASGKTGYADRIPELKKRLEYELETIETMGYVEYFLIVWDFIDYARSKGIPVGPGRGSGAGSLAAYCLRITDVDPIENNLIFERFLNPERVSMPDIDVDFCPERRGEVIDYVVKKYGQDRVSQIITFGTMKARAAIRDVGRVLQLGYSYVDNVARMIPADLNMTIDRAMALNPELRQLYGSDMSVKQMIDMAKALEGMPRHASTHAAGIVISRDPLDDYVPLYLSDKGVSVQFNMTTIEELGLLKMDFLGLRNLTVIRNALDSIERIHGVKVNFDDMSYDDPEVYSMIASGDTLGVFQLESGGMTQFMKNLAPDCFEDIIAGISLYRPGPMDSIPTYIENKKNPEKVKYDDPHLEPILSVTYGCIVYQEQVMQIVRDLAGYSYGRSDLVRRAMSKKKQDVMMKEREYFVHGRPADDEGEAVPGCVANGIPEQAAVKIFNDMENFASYAFNKSHAAAYAVLAFQTGWLKKHYPAEFMSALMTSVSGDSKQLSLYIRYCGDIGIKVLPPDVNNSMTHFSVHGNAVRFGFSGIKGMGEGAADEIIRVRNAKGRFADLRDFTDSVDTMKVNKKALESLIKAGAFDSLNENRAQLMAVYESYLKSAHNNSVSNVAGQLSMFYGQENGFENGSGVMDAVKAKLPDIKNFKKSVILGMEKEILGVYVSGHPLDEFRQRLNEVCSTNTYSIFSNASREHYDGEQVVIGGMIQSKRSFVTSKGELMAYLHVEDSLGSIEVLVFPRLYEQIGRDLSEDIIVVVRGRLRYSEDEDPKILASDVVDINKYEDPAADTDVIVIIPSGRESSGVFNDISRILKKYPGKRNVIVKVEATGKKFRANDRVKPCSGLYTELNSMLEKEAVQNSLQI